MSMIIPDAPEIIAFATYSHPTHNPMRVSALGEMANTSEKLRQVGLSQQYPHPVMVTQTRSCSLEPPPPPENIPAWKLIRPRRERKVPSDEPIPPPPPPRPEQWVKVTSTYVNYKVTPMQIPSSTRRPDSTLEKGAARKRRASVIEIPDIEEKDETGADADAPTIEEPPMDDGGSKSTSKCEQRDGESPKGTDSAKEVTF
jgi:hypothetical protein